MSYRYNPFVRAVAEPPIAEVWTWIEGRTFPPEKPLLDLCQAVPSYPPPLALREHVAAAVRRPETAFYTEILGIPALRDAHARHLSEEYGAEIPSSRVGITAGCNQGFCLAVDALAAPGDEVILPAPYYFNHQMWLELRGVTAVHLTSGEGSGAVPDAVAAAALITDRTRAIVLVTPNNPTGAEYPPDVIEAFFELARDRELALVIDETYKDFRTADGPPHGLFRRPDWGATLVQLYSFSKIYSLTGYRVGSLVAGEEMLDEVGKLADCLAICAPHIGQVAALFGIENLAPWRRTLREGARERVEALFDAFRGNRLRYRLISAGAFFAYVGHPFADEPAATVARRLADEQNLLTLPGSVFGPEQEGYLRLAFANLEASDMPELVRRLVASQP